jgi:hypothetical protein
LALDDGQTSLMTMSMPLVYLDTSNFITLGQVSEQDPARFETFLCTWRSKACGLALTRVHLAETRQHADATTRQARYRLLAQLAPIHTDLTVRAAPVQWPVIIQEREVVRALLERGMLRAVGDDSDEWLRQHTTIFPEVMFTSEAGRVLGRYEDGAFGTMVSWMRSAVESSTKAETRPRGTAYTRVALKDLPQAPIPQAEVERGLKEFDDIMTSDQSLAEVFTHLDAETARKIMAEHLEPLKKMIRRAGEVGIQRAYAEASGIESDFSTDRRTTDEVANDTAFRQSVERMARESWHLSEADAHAAASALTPFDCPGWWLAMQVHREMRLAEPEPAPSNAYDLDHLAYYPYVDLFLADKRVASYMRQVLRRPKLPEVLQNSGEPRSVARTVDAIEKVIQEL